MIDGPMVKAIDSRAVPLLCAWIAVALCACSAPRRAADERRIALRGLDPVLLIEGREVAGLPTLAVGYGRYRYVFSGPPTRERFEEDPERYAIQFDGDCARMQGGMPGDPDLFVVVDRRIYTFQTEACRTAFAADPDAYLVGAESPDVTVADEGPALTDTTGARQSWGGATGYAPGDWPQWGGPARNFKSPARGLARSWPAGGPRKLWRRELGEGFSSIAVEGDTLYSMFRRGSEEVAIALDTATGETRWEHAETVPFAPTYRMEYGPGPHATPLVVGDLVITAGATGHVQALDKRTGALLWRRDLVRDFRATLRQRGYSCSPLAYRDTVILMVGGRGTGVVALNRSDGTVAWRALDLVNSQASPILIEVDGQEQLVAFMADAVVGLNPRTGQQLWNVAHPTDWGLNASTPVWGSDHLLFVSSAYGGGSRMIRLTRTAQGTTASELWFTRRVRLHFGNALRLGPYVLGSSGDFGPALFVAVDALTGKPVWRERGLAKASFVYADGRLIILDEDGQLTLATPSASGLRIDSQAQVLDPVAWTVPALAGTTLYLRDRRQIMALDLR